MLKPVKTDAIRQLVKGTAWECLAYEAYGDSINLLRDGLPVDVIRFLAQLLRLDPTTFSRTIGVRGLKPGNKKLPRQDGDKIYRTIRALMAASQTFDFNNARVWLCRPIRSLGGLAPLTFMDTEAGFELVIQTLGRIDHGVVA